MRKMLNKVHLEGILYEHELKLSTTGERSKNPGTEYISGTISVATDSALTNIVKVNYTYVAANSANGSYSILYNIYKGNIHTYMGSGIETAAKVAIDSNISLNEFYSDKTGEVQLISVKNTNGGFIKTVNILADEEKERNYFDCDIVITNVIHKDADEERNISERDIIKGCIFDFKGSLLPVEFTAVHPGAMEYFEGLNASNSAPVFTRIKGMQISTNIVKEIREESAFGDASVRKINSSNKDWIITWARPETYFWDDADEKDTILASELTEAMAARQTYLATVKQRYEEYKNTKKTNSNAAIATSAPATDEFKF